jgi:hypothetical protein
VNGKDRTCFTGIGKSNSMLKEKWREMETKRNLRYNVTCSVKIILKEANPFWGHQYLNKTS